MSLNNRITEQIKTMGGWCDPAKAIKLADNVLQSKPQVCVEIGVFAGKSAIATAMALQENGSGILYAIDSWATSDSLVDTTPEDAAWWKEKVDLNMFYEEFLRHVVTTGVGRYIKIMRMGSIDASKIIPNGIDMLHIDGCHSEWSSTSDVCFWVPKLRQNGLLIMDDVNWPSVQTAVRFAEKFCLKLEILEASESVCGFFRKR